jgi:hypothetical protein
VSLDQYIRGALWNAVEHRWSLTIRVRLPKPYRRGMPSLELVGTIVGSGVFSPIGC